MSAEPRAEPAGSGAASHYGAAAARVPLGRSQLLGSGLVAADALAVGGAVTLVLAGRASPSEIAVAASASVLVACAGLALAGLYRRRARRVAVPVSDEIPRIIGGLLVLDISATVGLSAAGAPEAAAARLGVAAALAAGASPALRSGARLVLRRSVGPDRALLLGTGPARDRVASVLALSPARAPVAWPPADDAVDPLEFIDIADEVLVAEERPDPRMLAALSQRCGEVDFPLGFAVVSNGACPRLAVLPLPARRTARGSRRAKRVLDLVGALGLLVPALPVMAIVAAATCIDSTGGALFRQLRVGMDGRRFRMAKFRTMIDGAEGMTTALAPLSRVPHWLHLERDPRVTRVGRVLRTASLDELPQLWNVVKGQMSLVGPRPLSEIDDAQVPAWGRVRRRVPPGLTGPWQVLGRTAIDFEDMLRLDAAYSATWTVGGDVRLLLRTVSAVLRHTGAN